MAARVLIIDDDPGFNTLLSMLLEDKGHTVERAHTGAEGLDIAGRVPLDLAVIDLGLPGMDGCAVAKELRAAHPDLRLVALTGDDRPATSNRAREAGFDRHLIKGRGLAELETILDDLGV